MSVLQYCSVTDLQNRLSDDGLNLRIDDKPTVTTAVINRASVKINNYLASRYDPLKLVNSDWVREAATTLGSVYVCQRRLNTVPLSLWNEYEETMGELKAIHRGTFRLADIPLRKQEVPVLSNVRIRLDPFPRTVVEVNRSTGTPQNYTQNSDKLDFLDYSI